MFTKEVIERFQNPRNIGKLKDYNAKGKSGDAKCSDIIELYVKFSEKKVEEIKFMVFGCPGAVSTTDAFIDIAKGKSIGQALKITQEDISKELNGLPMEYMHCSKLAIRAFRNAAEEYKKNV